MGGGASSVKSEVPSNHKDGMVKGVPEKEKSISPNIKEHSRNNTHTNSSSSQQSSSIDKIPENPSFLEGNNGDSIDSRIANNKLKRLAFGQQGYMDQQRDYDETLSKMEFNKVSQLQWSPPPSNSTSVTVSANMQQKSSFSSNENRSVKKPAPPPRKPVSDATGSSIPATHQAVLVPSFDNLSPNPHNNRFGTSNSTVDRFDNVSVNNSTTNSVKTVSNKPITRPIGKPPEQQSRYFPDINDADDDADIGDFTSDSNIVLTPSKRPDNIPMLSITPTSVPLNTPFHTHSTLKSSGSHSNNNSSYSVINNHSNNSSTKHQPRIVTPEHTQQHLPIISQSSESTKPPPNRPSAPHFPPISTSSPPLKMNQSPIPVNATTPEMNLPMVKETKDVRRNRAQIPDTLRHAKPNTGNWLNNRYIVNNYILLDVLGTGSYGEVRMCKDRITEKIYAIKIISKDFLKKRKNNKTTETYFEDIKREIAIMKQLLHPNILRLFEVLDDPNVNKMYLVLEYMKMGDLVNILKSRPKDETNNYGNTHENNVNNTSGFTPLSDYEVWNIFRQLASGIKYLHLRNVVHGDIKPQNLLLGEDGVLKVADFGISHMLSASGQKLADAAGTPAFMSPELCEGKSFSGQLADIWAIGATVFMLRFGHPPFIAKNIINLYSKIVNDPLVFPHEIDPGLRNLLENLLEKDPLKRFTMQQIMTHPWLRHVPLLPSMKTQKSQPSGNESTTANTVLTDLGTSSSSTPDFSQQDSKKPVDNSNKAVHRPLKDSGKTPSMLTMLTFIPPPTYDAEEAAAMKEVLKEIDNHDIFMSIGGIQKPPENPSFENDKAYDSVFEQVDVDDEDIDSDDCDAKVAVKESSKKQVEAKNKQASKASSSNIMDTNWGADVFGIVEHSAEVDDDSDDDDEEDDKVVGFSTKESTSKSQSVNVRSSVSSAGSTSTKQPSERTHNEMSEEEEKRRSKRFLNKITRKSTENMLKQTSNHTEGDKNPTLRPDSNAMKPVTRQDSMDSISSSEEITCRALKDQLVAGDTHPIKAISRDSLRGNVRHRMSTKYSSSSRSVLSRDDYDEETDQLTMDDFNKMMDTLAQQPSNKHSIHNEADEEEKLLTERSFNNEKVIAQLRNIKNAVAAAFHSEKGGRTSQEDRCVLHLNVARMKVLESVELDSKVLDAMSNITMACMFDGHNGHSSSQYLSQHLPAMIVMHPKFLERKQLDSVIADVCKTIDKQLCKILREEDDVSGSTGIIAVYDGRKHLFTVAGVGDSMCVLSRGGRAVVLNKMHRLDNEVERERIRQAGGTVLNSRVNGILAVSRAFGDIEFKGEDSLTGGKAEGKLLIADPEVHSEIITPMTEFVIIATDGLWDIMSPQVAVSFVRKFLSQHHDLQHAVNSLTAEAVKRGSVDNVTALIMTFNTNQSDDVHS
mmetsp:Transcript_9981/g.13725  ORF Transcript_9981/g.13725 Transcript_9981/m.13725 type:complete len:1417 (+) Transcript_9981:52-4302(+)